MSGLCGDSLACMHAENDKIADVIPIKCEIWKFKRFCSSNHLSDLGSVFTVELVTTRSLKLDTYWYVSMTFSNQKVSHMSWFVARQCHTGWLEWCEAKGANNGVHRRDRIRARRHQDVPRFGALDEVKPLVLQGTRMHWDQLDQFHITGIETYPDCS